MRTYNNRYLFSRRIGCHHYQGAYGVDLAQLCVRPKITTDDAATSEAGSGDDGHPRSRPAEQRDGEHGPVDYATADGTAHAGEDYVATSGTLIFAPHERLRNVDVTINSDGVDRAGRDFFLNLSNESSGTMVDAQAVVTITGTGPSSASPHHRRRHLPTAAPPPPPPPAATAASTAADAAASSSSTTTSAPDPAAARSTAATAATPSPVHRALGAGTDAHPRANPGSARGTAPSDG